MSRITYETRKIVYESAIAEFGATAQSDMAIEEMSELTKEICKNKRGRDNASEIADEIADVLIMLEQLQIIHGVKCLVSERMDYKIARLEERICEHISRRNGGRNAL